jgi:hypothetical protein
MKKYRISYHDPTKIEELEIIRETKFHVIIKEPWKEQKETDRNKIFDTWEEAHAFLTKRAHAELENVKDNIKQLKEMFDKKMFENQKQLFLKEQK